MSLGQPDRNRIRIFVIGTLSIGLLCIAFIFWFTYPNAEETDAQSLRDVPAIVIPPGGTTIAESRAQAPGTDSLGDHTFNTNAMGTLKIGGPSRVAGLVSSNREAVAGSEAEKINAGLTKETQIQRGKAIYWMTCIACHQTEGQGVPGQIPPLAKADVLMGNKEDTIRRVLTGCKGEIVVNGKTYNSIMPPLSYLADEHIANMLTYVRNSWGNSGDAVTIEEVAKIRQQTPPPPPLDVFE